MSTTNLQTLMSTDWDVGGPKTDVALTYSDSNSVLFARTCPEGKPSATAAGGNDSLTERFAVEN